MVTSFKHYNDVTDQRKASVPLFVFYLSPGVGTGMRDRNIEISHMDKNNGNPNLVCENTKSHLRQSDPETEPI